MFGVWILYGNQVLLLGHRSADRSAPMTPQNLAMVICLPRWRWTGVVIITVLYAPQESDYFCSLVPRSVNPITDYELADAGALISISSYDPSPHLLRAVGVCHLADRP